MQSTKDAIITLRFSSEECRKDKSCWGPLIWKQLDKSCDLIPCDTCREHCHNMISAEHDILNVFLNKPVYNMQNLQNHLKIEELVKSKLMQTQGIYTG